MPLVESIFNTAIQQMKETRGIWCWNQIILHNWTFDFPGRISSQMLEILKLVLKEEGQSSRIDTVRPVQGTIEICLWEFGHRTKRRKGRFLLGQHRAYIEDQGQTACHTRSRLTTNPKLSLALNNRSYKLSPACIGKRMSCLTSHYSNNFVNQTLTILMP